MAVTFPVPSEDSAIPSGYECSAEPDMKQWPKDFRCDKIEDDVVSFTASIASEESSKKKRSSFKKEGGVRRESIKTGKEITLKLPSQDKVRKQRSISFCNDVKVRSVNSFTDMDGLSDELWFKDEDYEGMVKSSMEIVDKVKESEEMKDTSEHEEDARGLEKFIEADQVLENKYWAWDTVLDEQETQREMGYWNDDMIAEAYQSSTADAAKAAAERAKRDQKDIDEYLQSARQDFVGNKSQ